VLSVPSPMGVRWMQFGLSSVYELGQWRLVEIPNPASEPPPEFTVLLGRGTELPLPAPIDESPWSETLLAQLETVRTRLSISWELLPDSVVSPLESWFLRSDDPPPKDTRNPSLPERNLKDRTEARRMGLRWRVRGAILADAGSKSREAASQLARALEAASHLDGGNRLICRPARSPLSRLRANPVLSEAEVVGLFPPAASVAWTAPCRETVGQARLWLGRDLKGASAGLPLDPEQGRHLLVLGETGMGKSTLLVQLAWQATRWGSVLLFDPVGDIAREFLAGIPAGLAPRVSWVSSDARGLTLSLLDEVGAPRNRSATHRERLLGDIVAALRRVRAGRYAESSFWGPRLEEMLFQAVRAASQWPGATLALAEQLLSAEGVPWRNVPESAREAVREVRHRIDRSPQDGDGARRLLSEITRSEVLREMLDASPPTWSVRSAVIPGRITVVSGDAPQVGETVARYLLALVLALAWNAVLERARPSKVFLILDEAQWYAHDSVAEMLRLGRRFNLHIWAVTQSLRSLPEVVRDAFMTNSADVVLFRGDPSDVRDVSRWAPHIAPERIMRMPRGEAAVLIDKGSETRWIQLAPPVRASRDPDLFRTLPPDSPVAKVGGANFLELKISDEDSADRTAPLEPFECGSLADALADLASRSSGLAEMTVRLDELRSRCSSDPRLADQRVRSGGRFLSSIGAIIRKGRDSEGHYWVLSRPRVATALAELAGNLLTDRGTPTARGEARPGQDEAS
jgi:hypothetical protein